MKILLLAGEESGARYAGELRARLVGHEVRGYDDAGFAVADLAVMGFWPVLRRIFFFLRVARTMRQMIATWRPDVVCTIDYPGLNLKLAAYAKALGIRTVHVVCPQVWAWKKGRIPKIEAALDRLCCFFPFEPGYFRPGFATFVGHPLVDGFEAQALPREKGLLALLPGSRMGEVERNLPRMLAAVARLKAVKAVIPAANGRVFARISQMALPADVRVVRGGARDLLRRADCAVVASGTATLEAALARCPTVLVYAVSPFLAWFARWAIRGIRHIGLANIVWEKAGGRGAEPMPELIQETFTPEAVANYVGAWLANSAARAEAVARLESTVGLLRSDGRAMDRIANEVLERKNCS